MFTHAIIPLRMRPVDLGVIAAYLIFITWFGAQFKKSQKSLKDYFLGGRGAPWWAIAFSIVSAETSTLTVIGTPAISFAGNFTFLQLILGYLLGRIVICVLFLPQYFRGELFTAYELMQRRFGPHVRKFTAGTFLVLRALAEGVRVFAVSIVVSIVLGTGELASIAVIVCLTLFYTFEGGMTAVIWTDVVQMILYVGGALLSFFLMLHLIPGGWPHVLALAAPAHKFQMFDFQFSLSPAFFRKTYTFWAGLLGGCFLTTASHGTEQLLVQRLLSAKNQRESRLALLSSWVVVFFQFALFLIVGVLLYVLYRDAGRPVPADLDRIYPEFIWRHLPVGLAGLVVAAILAAAMSNLSAALNALASTTVMDFFKPIRPRHTEQFYLRLARWTTVFWGIVLFVIGFTARHWGRVLEAGLTIASILYGALLGVFLLGVLTRRPGEWAAIVGMSAGWAATLLLQSHVAYTWYVMIGSLTTFIVGYGASFLIRERKPVPIAA
ncbi:MAG TPA: sodium:solute symporter [Bryobacteraceae bacterium]|nr:sodium:solute symporter [Bryobacteraceae bacterium]